MKRRSSTAAAAAAAAAELVACGYSLYSSHPPTFTGIVFQSDGSDGGRVLYLQLWGFTQRKRREGGGGGGVGC